VFRFDFDVASFCSELERMSDLPLGAPDLSLSIAPGLSVACDVGDCPVVSCALPVALLSGAAWPVVCGDFCSPAFIEGATFSAGAFCCAAGAGSGGSLPIPCAEAAPPPSSNAIATVDNSFVFLTGCLLWMPLEIPDDVGTSRKKRFVRLAGSETYGFAMKAPRHCVPGSTKAPFLLGQGGSLGDSFFVG
jgi:hypothetical protein